MTDIITLDSEQERAVRYPESCMVIAGPGSGKTRTLVAKAEELYAQHADIICLTFTRAAAKEMQERMPGIEARTIHSYCHGEVGWTGDYDAMLHEFSMQEKKYKWDWVLVDEVQDLTDEELDVVLSIVGKRLFAVGDPYQSIYGFNGALGMGIFNKLPYTQFHLKNNYRSTPEIVTRLNNVYDRKLVSKGVKNTGTTAILARTRKNAQEASEALEALGIGHTFIKGGSELSGREEIRKGDINLKVMTCHCSKGLQFDWVILYKWFPEPYHGEEKNLYYVSMSRATTGFCTVWDPKMLDIALTERHEINL